MISNSWLTKIIWLVLASTMLWDCRPNNSSKSTDHFTPASGYILRDGLRLNYLKRGAGIPLVIIGSMTYYTKAFSAELDHHFELIFTDARHFVPDCQESSLPAYSLTLADFAADLEALRLHLNLPKVNLVGHSVHAQIALEYAHQYPDYVGKLIIIGGVPYAAAEYDLLKSNHWNQEADALRKSTMDSNLMAFELIKNSIPPDQQFATSYHYFAPYNWVDPSYNAQPILADLRTCPAILGKLFMSLPSKKEITAKIKQLTCPTLIIHGRLDFTVPHTAWEGLPALNPKVTFNLMDSASHNPQTEGSTVTEFNRLLMAWLKTK